MLFLEAKLRGRTLRWPLQKGRFVVGRGSECDIIVDDGSVSREHLLLEIEAGRVHVKDLGSTNGTWIGGERIERGSLDVDEWIVLGSVMISIRRGLSMASVSEVGALEGRPSTESRDLSPVASGTTWPADAGTEGRELSREWISSLARCLRKGEGIEERKLSLLRFLGRQYSLDGVSLLVEAHEGWSLAGHWGQLSPALDAARDLASFVDLGGGSGKLLSLDCPSQREAVLFVHPWHRSAQVPDQMRLVASILGMTLADCRDDGRPKEAAGLGVVPLPQVEEESLPPFIAISDLSQRMLVQLDRLADSDLPVLLHGESGTGKELLAHRLHRNSRRASGPFIVVNCAAIPTDLLEAELFGIEAGVATGVVARVGRFELARGGTLFLDEIGDMPLALQPKLLRALESGEVSTLGAARARKVDVRLISASHRDLEQQISEGAFRQDLHYRLAGAVVRVPALRERPDEILAMARVFAREAASSSGRRFGGIDIAAARALLGYGWPGNVRELRHAIARAVALSDGSILHAGLLPETVIRDAEDGRGDLLLGLREDFRTARDDFERVYFSRLLERCDGNLSQAARLAGMSRSSLYRKLQARNIR